MKVNQSEDKLLSTIYKVIMTVLVLSAIGFVFDSDHTNGFLLLIVMEVVNFLYDYIKKVWLGKQKSALLELVLVISSIGVLVWGIVITFNI